MVRNGFALLGAAVAGVMFSLPTAHAAPVMTYLELGNAATQEVTTYSPLQVALTDITTPFGTVTITQPATDWILTFHPDPLLFRAQVTNAPAGGGMSTATSGKLDFVLTFDAPIQIQATITEGGSVSTSGNGVVNVFAGAYISENDHPVPVETIAFGGIPAIIGATSWSATGLVTGFTSSHFSYKFSIDNDLFADALASAGGGDATITKSDFVITITPGAGSPAPEPASLGVLGLGAAALLARRRR